MKNKLLYNIPIWNNVQDLCINAQQKQYPEIMSHGESVRCANADWELAWGGWGCSFYTGILYERHIADPGTTKAPSTDGGGAVGGKQ